MTSNFYITYLSHAFSDEIRPLLSTRMPGKNIAGIFLLFSAKWQFSFHLGVLPVGWERCETTQGIPFYKK